MLVLADTSTFIDFFRGKKTDLDHLILENSLILSAIIKLEIFQGIRKTELNRLNRLFDGLHYLIPSSQSYLYAENILKKIKGKGLTLGITDLILCAQAQEADCLIYSSDKVFYHLSELGFCKTYSTFWTLEFAGSKLDLAAFTHTHISGIIEEVIQSILISNYLYAGADVWKFSEYSRAF